jgi:hypothetical protein
MSGSRRGHHDSRGSVAAILCRRWTESQVYSVSSDTSSLRGLNFPRLEISCLAPMQFSKSLLVLHGFGADSLVS